jgi:hypothetical protein
MVSIKDECTLAWLVDLEKVYDSIWREGLMVKLYNMGIKGKIWLFPLVPFIRSSMKMLNRVGDITEPCGRPILVSNSSPKKSPSMHGKV